MTNQMNNLVSVIIPVYNSEKFLKESIESIINQTYPNIEIICVDDGSTDNSKEILQQYFDKIQVISQSNQGLASALNNGIGKASGRWIKWFSPDDVMLPDAIEILVNQIKKFPNTIVYSNWEIIDEKGKKIREFSESNYNDLSEFDYNIRLLDSQQINVNTTLIPLSLFQKGCVFRNLEDPVAIDYDFFLQAALQYNTRFHLIPKPLIQYRIHQNQLSHKNISKTLDYIQFIRSEILNRIDPKIRNQYILALKSFQKDKPIGKKVMSFGLTSLKFLPPFISDNLLTFYLNKLRSSR
jgi:glycosyltransferase involved in cell wall biosynthesis